ncbi:hypothetical protein M8818_005401 [Zalaria obscura]|uniref:Uncharacterized protein n=1 Tax=Zalaria obscura TaxID=2024903 RepID=A0ACC3S8F1_9PEZI
MVTLVTSDCVSTGWISLAIHLAINVASTLLLVASNNAIQGLSAPTRAAIDQAHQQGKWLDIGVSGLRNFGNIGWRHSVLCLLLAVGSLPLHLLYNSVVVQTIPASDFFTMAVPQEFVTNPSSWNQAEALCNPPGSHSYIGPQSANFQYALDHASNWTRLDPSDCIRAYGREMVSQYANLIIVTPGDLQNNSELYLGFGFVEWNQGSDWICQDTIYAYPCHIQEQVDNAASWGHWGGPCGNVSSYSTWLLADHCLAQDAQPACTISMNPTIMGIVIASNLLKLVCLILAIFPQDSEPLLTIGDAIQSFLDEPDATTTGSCTLSMYNVRNVVLKSDTPANAIAEQDSVPAPWSATRHRWAKVTSKRRQVVATLLFCVVWVTGFILIFIARSTMLADPYSGGSTNLAYYGLGQLDIGLIVNTPSITTIAGNALLANTPQLIISMLYVLYNGFFTSMLLALEWSSTGIPIDKGYGKVGCGFSPLGIVLSAALSGAMLLVLWGFALWRRYDSSMPLVGSCSLAISAACHTDQWDVARGEVMWGVVYEKDGIRHATFSRGDVQPLREGGIYA